MSRDEKPKNEHIQCHIFTMNLGSVTMQLICYPVILKKKLNLKKRFLNLNE